MTEREPCEICGRWDYLQKHHIFEGVSLRRKSEKYKATIRICYKCHEDIHKHPRKYLSLKENAQREIMQRHGWAMEDWHREFGKNYLEEYE